MSWKNLTLLNDIRMMNWMCPFDGVSDKSSTFLQLHSSFVLCLVSWEVNDPHQQRNKKRVPVRMLNLF